MVLKQTPLIRTELTLNKKKHQYRIKGKGAKLQSVTEWIKSFDPPFKKFDEQAQAERLSKKEGSEYYGLTVKQILKKWKKKADYGTCVHQQIEDYIRLGIQPEDTFAKQAIEVVDLWKKDNPLRIHTERIICAEKIGLAGTIDMLVEYEDGVWIVDWKTNKQLYGDLQPNFKGKNYKELQDANLISYSLQLNTYAYILENFYERKVMGMLIVHLTENGNRKYLVPDMKEQVEQMLGDTK